MAHARPVSACLAAALVAISGACTAPDSSSSTPSPGTLQPASTSTLTADVIPAEQMQATVMALADEQIAAIAEAIYLLADTPDRTAESRALAQSFLRNGVGACLDIATGPNPAVALLDLLVIARLQPWAFERRWIPAGIGPAGQPALERLRKAQTQMWAAAEEILTDNQLEILSDLIDAWQEAHPDRTVVGLVRFNEFADERWSEANARRAGGLLRELSEATSAIDDAKLFGERAIWYMGRYPYVLGEQAELTAFRLLNQPEAASAVEALESLKSLSATVESRLQTLDEDIARERDALFTAVAAERAEAIRQAQVEIEVTVQRIIDETALQIEAQREQAIDQFFDRFRDERTTLFNDVEERSERLETLFGELQGVIEVSGGLANELTGTVNSIDRVVARFDRDPDSTREPLEIAEIRDTISEAAVAIESLTTLLDSVNTFAASDNLDQRIASATEPVESVVDTAFWRGLILVCVFVAGMGLIRLIPSKRAPR